MRLSMTTPFESGRVRLIVAPNVFEFVSWSANLRFVGISPTRTRPRCIRRSRGEMS
jgi:hypothetical protein